MKKGIKTFCKVLSVFLAVLFVIEILPLQVMAEEFTDAVAQKEFIEDIVNNPTDAEKDAEADILYEVEEKRDEYTKVYKKSDGTYTAVMTEEPLHYLDDGAWKEIDNSMILNGSLYTNLSNLFNVELPKNIDENKELTVEKDGYELSFSVDNIENSSAVVENNIVASDTEIESADKAISQTQSSVTYNDIADNTNLQYIVTPNSIKENIIVSNKESVKDIYTFTFETNGLNAEKQDDGSILFKDNNGDVKFTIPRPVMNDSNFAFSYDIGVSVTKNANSTVTLEYTPSIDWTSSSDRVYPVTIDPAIVVGMRDSGWVEDTSVMYKSSDEDSVNENLYGEGMGLVANRKLEDDNTYIGELYTKINVDVIKSLGTNITLTEVQYLFGALSFGGNAVAKKIAENVDFSTVTYATKPELEAEIIDYHTSLYTDEDYENSTIEASFAHFNITEAVNGWLNGEANNGFAVVAGNEGYYGLYFTNVENPSVSNTTVLMLDFVDVAGNSEYFNYHSQSAGRAGTGYVNDFTQSLSVIRDDLSIDGNIMPVTVGMTYNPSQEFLAKYSGATSTDFYCGLDWMPNYHRIVASISYEQILYYTDKGSLITFDLSTDEDGKPILTETNADIYGESGYTAEFVAKEDGTYSTTFDYLQITRPDGYIERFYSNGYLKNVSNPDEPEQKISVYYEYPNNIGRIDYITDGVGRKYDYIYNDSENLLTKIKCYSADGTEILAGTTTSPLEMNYTYDEDRNLTGVTFPDGKTINYEYDENGNMTSMTNIDGYRVKYEYDSNERITKVTEQAYNGTKYVDGNYLTYERLSATQIKLTDGNGQYEIYQFGNKGNLLYTIDSNGNYIMNEDSGSNDETYFISSSDYRVNSQNLLINPSFEEKNVFETGAKGWSVVGSPFERTFDENNAYFGDYVLKTANENNAIAEQVVPVLSGGKYTLSAYVKSEAESGQYLKLTVYSLDGSNEIKATDTETIGKTGGEWQRHTATITAPEGTEKIVVEISNQNGGTFLIDNVQLEQSPSESSYTYLADGGFRNDLDYWVGSDDFEVVDVDNVNNKKANAVLLTGGADAENTIYQTVTINGKKDDVFTVGGWLKSAFINSSTNNEWMFEELAGSQGSELFNFTNDRYAQIEVTYQYTETSEEETEETISEPITETIVVPFAENIDNWQFAAQDFALKGDCEEVTVLVRYSKHTNTALVSNIELSKDEDAVVISEDDEEEITEEETATCLCEDCEEVKCPCTCESETLCGCKYCKRRSNTSTTDSFGNITSSNSIFDDKTIETLSNYTADGNYLISETDADGNTVTYDYNTLNGILTAITDANGNQTTYSYDANGMLTQISANDSLTSSANYVYNNDRLVAIAHNGFTYNFTYNMWGQLTSVSVGDTTIIVYRYGTGANRDQVVQSIYINGSSSKAITTYEYQNGKIIRVRVNNIVKYEYGYDSLGNVRYINEPNVRTVKYTDGRTEIKYPNRNTPIYSSYTNADGDLVEIINGVKYTSKSYDSEYDIDTGITTEFSDVSSTKGKVIGTVDKQDWFGRYTESVVKTESATDTITDNNFASVKTEYAYPEYEGNKTSNRVESYSNTITYGIDTSEENKTNFYGFAYDYDANGNIIAEYKQGVNGAKTLRYSYVYDELNQLVRVDDKVSNTTYTYTYDGAGNILSKSEYIYTTDETITDEPEKVTNYTYDTVWKDKLATYDGKEFTYDNIGNPLTFDGASFTWSGRELVKYTKDGKEITFKYDENGLRHRKTITENGVITEQYDYVWSDGVLISQTHISSVDGVTTTDTAKFIYDSWGTLQGFILNDSETYLYVKNLQGDIIAIVDELGEVIVEYSYDAWGNVTFHETSLQNMSKASTLCFVSPFTYRGYCYDYDIELYYLQSRYYSAEIGRFINTDDTQIAIATMGTVLGANLFAYCENNAVNRVDFTGEFGTPIQWACAIIGAIIGVPFGKWLANKLGYYSGAKYIAIRAATIVGGAVLGWFAGTLLIKLVKKYLLSHPEALIKISTKYGSNALKTFRKIFGSQIIENKPILSWLYKKATSYAASSSAIGTLFETWYYEYYKISERFRQISGTINGIKYRLDAIVNGRIIELKNYDWSKYGSYKSIISSFVKQAEKYLQLVGTTIEGQKIKGVTFYFSSEPPRVIIEALKDIGVKVEWVK